MDELRQDALANATKDAASRGFDVEAGTEIYTVINPRRQPGWTSAPAPDQLMVRCTVNSWAQAPAKIHAEGPMNG